MRRSLLIALVACSLACKSKPSAEDIARIEAEDKAEQAAGDLSDPLPRIDEELKKRKEAALAYDRGMRDLLARVLPEGPKVGAAQAPASVAALDGAVPFAVEYAEGSRLAYQSERLTKESDPRVVAVPSRVDFASPDCLETIAHAQAIIDGARYKTSDPASTKALASALAELKATPPKLAPQGKLLVSWSRCAAGPAHTYREKGKGLGATEKNLMSYECAVGMTWIDSAAGTVLASVSGKGSVTPETPQELTDRELYARNSKLRSLAIAKGVAGLKSAVAAWKP